MLAWAPAFALPVGRLISPKAARGPAAPCALGGLPGAALAPGVDSTRAVGAGGPEPLGSRRAGACARVARGLSARGPAKHLPRAPFGPAPDPRHRDVCPSTFGLPVNLPVPGQVRFRFSQ